MVTPMTLFGFILGLTLLIFVGVFATSLFGIVIIREHEVGIVVKKFGPRLPPGQLIALEGEAGYFDRQTHWPLVGILAIFLGNTLYVRYQLSQFRRERLVWLLPLMGHQSPLTVF